MEGITEGIESSQNGSSLVVIVPLVVLRISPHHTRRLRSVPVVLNEKWLGFSLIALGRQPSWLDELGLPSDEHRRLSASRDSAD
jgi:hypothetical protein